MSFLSFLHDLRSPALTAIFRFFTMFGEEVIIVLVLSAIYWCVNKELGFGVAISFFASALLIQGLKIIFRIDRPWVIDPAFVPVAQALAGATGYSFPSGHTQTAASVFGYLGLASGKKRWIAASWALVTLVGLSRMYLGVHTPLDVIGAIVLSLAVSLLTLAYIRSKRSDTVLLVSLGVLSALVTALALILHARGVIETAYVSDCVKAAGGCIGCAVGFLWARRKIPFSVQTPRLWQQVLKVVAGLVVLLGIKSGLKIVLGDSLIMDAIRYFLIALWALALYPLIFSKIIRPAPAE